MSTNKLYVIGVGGSGAKCLESMIHMAATGLLGDSKLEVLLVDPDESNGNVERTRNSLNIYQKCQQLVNAGDKAIDSGWMAAPIKYHGLWSPFAQESQSRELGSFFRHATIRSNKPELASFFDVLYSSEERTQTLDKGFRGRPSIGSAVMSQIDMRRLGEEPWSSLIQSIETDAGNGQNPRVLLCGSMFGGTGASGLPTIAKLIDNRLNPPGESKNIRGSIKLGCIFLLPYFSFNAPPDAESNEGLFASADHFLLNTEAALRYYADRSDDLFDAIYLLGSESTESVKFSVGSGSQRNQPHFIELMAALGARDFLLNDRDDSLMLLSRQEKGRITWRDLPDWPDVKKSMANSTRLSYVWLSEIERELEQSRSQGFSKLSKLIPWLDRYYDSGDRGESVFKFDTPHQQEAIKIISSWSRDYLRWINDLHQCESDRIELFQTQSFGDLNGNIRRDSLSDLIIDDARDPKTKKQQDDLAIIKGGLDNKRREDINRGTAGLAKALYKQVTLGN
jgi:hypothetical protein